MHIIESFLRILRKQSINCLFYKMCRYPYNSNGIQIAYRALFECICMNKPYAVMKHHLSIAPICVNF